MLNRLYHHNRRMRSGLHGASNEAHATRAAQFLRPAALLPHEARCSVAEPPGAGLREDEHTAPSRARARETASSPYENGKRKARPRRPKPPPASSFLDVQTFPTCGPHAPRTFPPPARHFPPAISEAPRILERSRASAPTLSSASRRRACVSPSPPS
jgi:hypothetical protein